MQRIWRDSTTAAEQGERKNTEKFWWQGETDTFFGEGGGILKTPPLTLEWTLSS